MIAPTALDNPESIKKIDDELKERVLVCFYTPIPKLMPVIQSDGTWPLRILCVDLKSLKWIKEVLLKYGFKIVFEKRYCNNNR